MSSGWSWDETRYQRKSRTQRLAESLHPLGSRVRMMAIFDLRAYFDESGTDTSSTTVVVAGYLAPADDWSALESQWLDALKARNAPY